MGSKYQIAADDREHVAEFMRDPVGIHSPRLRRVMTRLRSVPVAGKYCLVCIEPHKRWMLAELSGERGIPPKLHRDVVYHDLEEAERDIFKRRWKYHTGEALD